MMLFTRTLLLVSVLTSAISSPGVAQSHHAGHSGKDAWRAAWQRQWLAAHSRQSKSAEKPVSAGKSQADKQSGTGAQPAASAAANPAAPAQATATAASAPSSAASAPASLTSGSAANNFTNSDKAVPTAPNPAPFSPAAPTPVPAPATALAAQQKLASPAGPVPKPAPTTASAKPAAPANAVKTAAPSASHAAPAMPLNLVAHTRPDLFAPADAAGAATGTVADNAKPAARMQDTPLSPVAGAWKMIAYMLPMLLVIVGCINLLKRFQTKTGRLPGALNPASRFGGSYAPSAPGGNTGLVKTLLAGFHLPNARPKPRASIRLLESAPVGGASVHLLEVRGRVLLLGATSSSLNLLTEFAGQEDEGADEFQNMLHAAAADMDAMDYAQPDLPASATVSTLEELLRETGQAVSQRSRRLRTVGEVEGEDV